MAVAKITLSDVKDFLESAGAKISKGFEGVHFGLEDFSVIHQTKNGRTVINKYCYNDGLEHE